MKYFIALFIVLFALVSCDSDSIKEQHPQAAVPVQVSVANPIAKSLHRLLLSGQLEAVQSVNISTRMMGFVTSIPVSVGERVNKGAVLVRINQQDLTAKKAQTVALWHEAEAALVQTEKDYKRYTQLFEKGSATAKELESMTLNYQSAKSREESIRQLAKEVDASIAYANLTAPFSGTISRKLLNEGDMASPGMPILTLEQAGDLQVQINVPETDINKIKEGQSVEVHIPAIDKRTTGEISQISQSSKYSGGQYLVKVRLKGRQSKDLYAGMYAHVTIPLPSEDKAYSDSTLWIPLSSVINKDQLACVYILQNQHAIIRWIRVGKTDGNQIEVLSGLNSDDQYVLNPDKKIENGSLTKVINIVSH